nr:RlmF-related methyltransferase [Candidatus Freyarchaeota archaeon]
MKTIKVKGGLPLSEALRKYPELIGPHLISQAPPKIDLKNRDALAAYNKIVAREVLGVELSFHPKALIPAVMSRFEFVRLTVKPNETVLDVGTGSSAICAIIAAKHFNSTVYATELVEEYYETAKANISRNSLQDRIHLLKSSGNVIKGVVPEDLRFNAIISAPPYLPSGAIVSDKKFGGSAADLIGGGRNGADFSLKLVTEGAPRLEDGGRIGLIIPMKKKKVSELILNQMKRLGLDTQTIRLVTGNRERLIIMGSSK